VAKALVCAATSPVFAAMSPVLRARSRVEAASIAVNTATADDANVPRIAKKQPPLQLKRLAVANVQR